MQVGGGGGEQGYRLGGEGRALRGQDTEHAEAQVVRGPARACAAPRGWAAKRQRRVGPVQQTRCMNSSCPRNDRLAVALVAFPAPQDHAFGLRALRTLRREGSQEHHALSVRQFHQRPTIAPHCTDVFFLGLDQRVAGAVPPPSRAGRHPTRVSAGPSAALGICSQAGEEVRRFLRQILAQFSFFPCVVCLLLLVRWGGCGALERGVSPSRRELLAHPAYSCKTPTMHQQCVSQTHKNERCADHSMSSLASLRHLVLDSAKRQRQVCNLPKDGVDDPAQRLAE